MWTSFSISSSPPSSSPPRPPRRSSRRPRPPRSPPPRPRPPPPPRPPRGPRPSGRPEEQSRLARRARLAPQPRPEHCLGWGRGFGRSRRLGRSRDLGSGFAGGGVRLRGFVVVQPSRTPIRLRGRHRPAPSRGHGTGSRRDRTRRGSTPAFLARSAMALPTAAAPSRVAPVLPREVLVEGRGRGHRPAGGIVDDLRIDVPARAVDRQARLAGGTRAERGAHAAAAAIEEREFGHGLLLLAFFAEDILAAILDALALVGLRLAPAADFGGDLADLLPVDAADLDRGGVRRLRPRCLPAPRY